MQSHLLDNLTRFLVLRLHGSRFSSSFLFSLCPPLFSASLLGVGLAFLAEERRWDPITCAQDPGNATLIVTGNGTDCTEPYYTVLLSVNGGQSAYLMDPTPSLDEAETQLSIWEMRPSGNFTCLLREDSEGLSFPAYCDTCTLDCPSQVDQTTEVLRVTSEELTNYFDIAMLFIAIGTPVCAVFMILLILSISLCQRREDQKLIADASEVEELREPEEQSAAQRKNWPEMETNETSTSQLI